MPDTSPNEGMRPMSVAPGKQVKPAHVVKLSPLADFSVEHALATDIPFGISQNWTHSAPGTPFDDGFVSTVDDPSVMVWGPGSIAVAGLKANAPALTPGTSVGADANSELVAMLSGWAVGWLLESGTAAKSQRLRVFIHPHPRGAGAS